MTKDILKSAGIPFQEARYPDPPADLTYAVYFDDVSADGADLSNCIFTHDITVELYEPEQDAEAEAAVEAVLNARGISWTKQARYWLDSIHRYQVIYEFSYIKKS